MEEGFTKREKLVGLFLLLIVILTKVTLLVIAQGKGWFQSYRVYRVKLMEKGYNIHQGSLVKMLNTEIGKVSNVRIIRMEGKPTVEASVRILTEHADLIRRNSTAEVVTPTLFGSEYLEVSPGSPGYPPIPEQGDIPYFQSKKPFTDSVSELLNDANIKKVETILVNITQLTDQLKNQEKAWMATINHVDKVMLALLNSEGTLGELLTRRDIANRMNQTLEHMDKVLKEVNSFATDMKPVSKNLEELTQNLNREMQTLKSILADIKAGSPGFPKLMESATELSEEGTETVEAIKANPLVRMGLPKAEKGKSLHVEPRHVQ